MAEPHSRNRLFLAAVIAANIADILNFGVFTLDAIGKRSMKGAKG